MGVHPGGDLFAFHRAGGAYGNTHVITKNTIVRLSITGEIWGSFGAWMFVVPHGLYVDAGGHLWVTDTDLHQVMGKHGLRAAAPGAASGTASGAAGLTRRGPGPVGAGPLREQERVP